MSENKLKIAFISYEYPPDSAYGGIGTYVFQAARMLSARGHAVEVFSSSPTKSGSGTEDGIPVHRIVETNHQNFSAKIAEVFAVRHTEIRFDIVEGPEYGGDAFETVKRVPDIPLVIKLHTPTFLTDLASYRGLPYANVFRLHMLASRAKRYLFEFVRGGRPLWRYTYKYHLDEERLVTLLADEVVAPSKSIAGILTDAWRLNPGKIAHVPYPYVPSPGLLEVPIETGSKVVTFLGRLEIRKGVLDLARAIPLVLKEHPESVFRFVGSTEHSHIKNVDMKTYLEKTLARFSQSVEFVEAVPPDQIPSVLAATDICVFPSIWENFANVCLESMAAGRAIVASEAGGMAEMLGFGKFGRTVPPRKHRKIAEAIVELLDDPEQRAQLGAAARDRLLSEYSIERIGALQETSYRRAISRRHAQGRREI